MTNQNWIKSTVQKGSQEGRTIQYPTINLDPSTFPEKEQGVYASKIKYENNIYSGALYFGPRLIKNEKNIVLEIHILDFDRQIYDQEIEYQVIKFIRGIMNFHSMEEMKQQIHLDIANVIKAMT